MHLKPQLPKYIENRMGVREGWKGGGGGCLAFARASDQCGPEVGFNKRKSLIRALVRVRALKNKTFYIVFYKKTLPAIT